MTFKREPWILLYQYLLTGWCISWISNYNYYPQTHVRAHARWFSWLYVHQTFNHINARSIDRSPDYTYDAVASSYNTRFCCPTNAPGRKHIARSITYRCITVAYWRFNTCVLSYEHFFHANIHKTACEFLHSHDILVASDRATIVTGPLGPCHNWIRPL